MLEHLELKVGSFRYPAIAAGPPDGEVVLLLHGFPQTHAAWREVLPVLADAGYRAVAPTQRGYAATARPAMIRDYRLPSLIGDVLGFADHLGAERFHLVGHDWGGVVAWAFADRHGHRLRTLTSVATPHPRALRDSMIGTTQPARSAYVLFFRMPLLPEQALGVAGNRGLRWLLERSGLDGRRAAEYAAALDAAGGLRAPLHWYRAGQPGDLEVGEIAVPTLFVWPTRDVALGPAAAFATERYVRAPYRFVPVEGASHWVPEQHADTLAAALRAFLSSAEGGGS